MATYSLSNSDAWYPFGLQGGIVTHATFPKTPPVSTTVPLVLLGSTLLASGAAAGTYNGVNQSGTANFIDLQTSGTSKFSVDSTGAVTATSFTGSLTPANPLNNTIIGNVTPAAATFTTLTATGLVTFSRTGANALFVSGSPVASAVNALVLLDATIASGVAAGTYLGANTAGAFDFIQFEVSGTTKFNVANSGAVTTASTVNKLTLTPPATGATLTLTDGKTLAVTNTLTLSGTDSTVMTFPSVTASIPGIAVANTFTATQTFTKATGTSLAVGGVGAGAVNLGQTTVSQGTNINTDVTCSGASGVITTQSATTAAQATETGFTVTNTACAAASVVIARVVAYSGTYSTNGFPEVVVDTVSAGSFHVKVQNLHATNALSGTMKIHFAVL